MIIKLEGIREFKKKIKVRFINFETSIDLFYCFSSKKSINENVDNLKSKRPFSSFNNDFDETLSFENLFEKNITTRIAFRR